MIGWLKNRLKNVIIASDQILVRKSQRGDRDAYGQLYMKYLDEIYRYVYFRLNCNRENAEDISEVIFFKAWKNLGNLGKDNLNFRAWLYTIARNACIDYFRKSNHEVKLDENIESTSPDIEEKLILKSNIDILQYHMKLLTDEQREVITMKFINDMPNEEIAKVLQKREDAVRAIQHRALKKLREIIKND